MSRAKEVQLTITVPASLAAKASAVLISRGSSIDDFIRLKFKGLVRPPQIYGLLDRFTFGKYKGELVEDVIRADPSYIAWCLGEIEGFTLTPDALNLLQDMDVDL